MLSSRLKIGKQHAVRCLDHAWITSSRATARDLRSYFLKSIPEDVLDNALWQPLDREQGLLELIILRVRTRPDCKWFI